MGRSRRSRVREDKTRVLTRRRTDRCQMAVANHENQRTMFRIEPEKVVVSGG
jgi:hypothetical protein